MGILTEGTIMARLIAKDKFNPAELKEMIEWYEIDRKFGKSKYYTYYMQSIIIIYAKPFAIDWEYGLAYSSPNCYNNQPFEVIKQESVQTVTEWVRLPNGLETEDDINARVLKVAHYIILNDVNASQTAKALNLKYHTVLTDINNRLPILDPQLFIEVKKILLDGEPNYSDYKQRVFKVANYIILNDCNIKQASINFKLHYRQVHYIVYTRLPQIDTKLFNRVDTILKNQQAVTISSIFDEWLI